MSDPTKAIDRIGETIKEAFARPPRMPLRRHRDDCYWDEVLVLAGPVVLHGFIMPRYKTSGLSGDEWRIRAQLVVKVDDTSIVDRSFHDMNGLLTHAPGFIYAERSAWQPVDQKHPAKLVVKRKGIPICERDFPSFGEAAMGMLWHVVTANEGTAGVEWHHLTDDEERARCQQVGCGDLAVNFYRLKRLMYGNSRRCFLEPEYDFEGQYVWYCARHTTRGDCGLEDADDNLELVAGNGVAREHEVDESPSVAGGVVRVPGRGDP